MTGNGGDCGQERIGYTLVNALNFMFSCSKRCAGENKIIDCHCTGSNGHFAILTDGKPILNPRIL